MEKETTSKGTVLKVGIWYMVILTIFAAYANWLPQQRGEPPTEAPAAEGLLALPISQLSDVGMEIIFGTKTPSFGSGTTPIGKGQCPLCHMLFLEQKADRCPNLIGEAARSTKRPDEERYKMFVTKYADKPEADSGFKPHAKPGTFQYLTESHYCPNCYVVEGFGLKGSEDMISPMPMIHKPPISLSDVEIVAVEVFLVQQDTPGDFTAAERVKGDWESWQGRPLKAEAVKAGPPPGLLEASKIALPADDPSQIVTKMACFACHKIPTVAIAKSGVIGPMLIEGTNAKNRIKSPEYQKAVKAGKAHATTPKEYVMESIMKPDAFIVPGFADDMLKDFGQKFTFAALEKMVDFLLTLDEEVALKESPPLLRILNEKECTEGKFRSKACPPPPAPKAPPAKAKVADLPAAEPKRLAAAAVEVGG